MRVHLNLEYVPYDDIRREANKFLSTHSHRIGPPVQIEEIVEFDMGIHIVPLWGLREEHDIDGFTSSDLTQIYVDQSQYDHKIEYRYRFTLAHEIGHIVLHEDIFRRFDFADLEEYRAFIEAIDEDESSRLEYLANCFAGLVLVPAEHLEPALDEQLADSRLKHRIQEAQDAGLTRDKYLDQVSDLISERIARRFLVSAEVVKRRMEFDSLVQKIP